MVVVVVVEEVVVLLPSIRVEGVRVGEDGGVALRRVRQVADRDARGDVFAADHLAGGYAWCCGWDGPTQPEDFLHDAVEIGLDSHHVTMLAG